MGTNGNNRASSIGTTWTGMRIDPWPTPRGRVRGHAVSGLRRTGGAAGVDTGMDTQQGQSGAERPDRTDRAALDAYSQVVTGVAEQLLPHVASLRVWLRRGEAIATGSAVVLTDDGFLVTNAHV